tara:strand:+ start:172 stop:1197 length:1026 start_codon:yes stop_codon:yes gene_type:complete
MQADTAAPTQSAPQQSQTQPTSYVAPAAQSAAQAPVVGTSPQWVASSQPMAAPMSQAPAQTAVPYQNSAPTAYSPQVSQAPQQQESPYKEAFNKVVGLLSSPVQFPFQGQQSPQTQAIDPASFASQQTTQFANQGLQTSMPGINNNQVYSDNSSQTSLEITEDQLLANGVSPQSIQVIDHFGPDSAAILNDYSCQLEDAVSATNGQLNEAAGLLKELSAEHKVYERILTDPDILADYTCEFFGENGPYPVPAKGPAAPQGQAVGQQYANAPQVTGQPNVTGQAPSRPEMPVPQQPMRQANPTDFWNNFGQAADRNPQEAWKYLNAAQQDPEIFRQKLLVME